MNKIYSRKIGITIALTSIAIGLVGMVSTSYKTYAANINAGSLAISYSGSQLFNESNIKPGDVIVKDLTIKNNGSVPHSFAISAEGVSGILANALQLEPRVGGTAVWNETLANLAAIPGGSKVILPSIPAGESRTIQMAAILPATATNDLQGQSAVNFSFAMGNESTDQKEPSPQAVQSVTSTLVSTSGTLSGLLSSASSSDPEVKGVVSDDNTDVKGESTTAKSISYGWYLIPLFLLILIIAYYIWRRNQHNKAS